MKDYFYDLIPAEEREQLPYIPTVPEFVEWIEKKYADLPAESDMVTTYTYKQMCDRIARRRTTIANLGLQKGAKIAIFERNGFDAFELFLAVTSAGMVAINLPAQLPAPAVVGSCKRFDVEAIFVRDGKRDLGFYKDAFLLKPMFERVLVDLFEIARAEVEVQCIGRLPDRGDKFLDWDLVGGGSAFLRECGGDLLIAHA